MERVEGWCSMADLDEHGTSMASRLAELHIHVDPRWLEQMSANHPWDLEHVVDTYLNTDLRACGSGTLPARLDTNHVLRGKHVLQVDEAVDVSLPAKERFQPRNRHPNRCLKLALTDGKTDVVGFERTQIAWEGNAQDLVGCKILVEDLEVKRGVLVLVNERTVVLGGNSPTMHQARDRALARWNARRTREEMRQGSSIQSRVQEARQAAWAETGPQSNPETHAPENFANGTVHPPQDTDRIRMWREEDGAPQSRDDRYNDGQRNHPSESARPSHVHLNGVALHDGGPTDEEVEAMRETEAPVHLPHHHAHTERAVAQQAMHPVSADLSMRFTLNETPTADEPGTVMAEEEVEPRSSPSLVMPSPVMSVEQPSAQHMLIAPSQADLGEPHVAPSHLQVRSLSEVLEYNRLSNGTDALERVYVQGAFTHLQMDVSETQYSATGILEDGTASIDVRFPQSLLEERVFEMSPACFALTKEEEETKTRVAENLARFSDFDGLVHIWLQPANARAFVISLQEMVGESCRDLAQHILTRLRS